MWPRLGQEVMRTTGLCLQLVVPPLMRQQMPVAAIRLVVGNKDTTTRPTIAHANGSDAIAAPAMVCES